MNHLINQALSPRTPKGYDTLQEKSDTSTASVPLEPDLVSMMTDVDPISIDDFEEDFSEFEDRPLLLGAPKHYPDHSTPEMEALSPIKSAREQRTKMRQNRRSSVDASQRPSGGATWRSGGATWRDATPSREQTPEPTTPNRRKAVQRTLNGILDDGIANKSGREDTDEMAAQMAGLLKDDNEEDERESRRMIELELKRIAAAKEKFVKEDTQLESGEYLPSDLVRCICILKLTGGDWALETFVTLREELSSCAPRAIAAAVTSFGLRVKPQEASSAITSFPKEDSTEIMERLIRQRGGEVFDREKPQWTADSKVLVQRSVLIAEFQSQVETRRRWLGVDEIKTQLMARTGVKPHDQVLQYDSHELDAGWSFADVVCGDLTAPLVMRETPKVVELMAALFEKHQISTESIEDMVKANLEHPNTVEQEYSKIIGEIDVATFEDKIREERFVELLKHETVIAETRLEAKWDQLKWEGSTQFMEAKTRMLAEANVVLQGMLEANEELREAVRNEDNGQVEEDVEVQVHAESIEAVLDMIGEDRSGERFREEKKKLEARIRKDELATHKQQQRKREISREVLHYVAFLCIVSVVTYGQRQVTTGAGFFLPTSIREALIYAKATPTGVNLDEVKDMESLWRWIEDSPILFRDPTWYNGHQVLASEDGFLNLQTKIIGRIRFRQMRLQPQECQLPQIRSYVPNCYPSWSSSSASQESFGHLPNQTEDVLVDPNAGKGVVATGTAQHVEGETDVNTRNFTAWAALHEQRWIQDFLAEENRTKFYWNHTSASQNSDPAPVLGRFGTYGGSGFVVDMPLTLAGMLEEVQGMKKYDFLDNSTAALLVNINLYNGNLDMHGVVSILFETPYTGNVVASSNVQVARLFRYETEGDVMRLFLELCVIAYLAYFCLAEVDNCIGGRWKSHIKSLWTWLDIINLLLFLVQIPMQIFVTFWLNNSDLRDTPNETKYYELTYIFYLTQILLQLNALNINILYAKVFKYFGNIKAVSRVIQLFTKASEDLIVFNVLLLAVLLGFAQAGFVAFGAFSIDFTSYPTAIGTMIVSLCRSFDYYSLQERAPFFAALFFFSWAFLVIFLLLKNVPAILMFAYQCTNMSDQAVETVLLDPDLKIEMAKSLKFVYMMKHGGQEEIEDVCKSLAGFEKSVIVTLMTEEHLHKILVKAPNCLQLAGIVNVEEVITCFDSDGDFKLDKTDVQTFRLELEEVVKKFHELSILLS